MYRQRTQKARGHTAHRGANGVAMPTDEDDQDGHFFYNHPERGAYSPPRRAQPLLLLSRSNPPTEGGGREKTGLDYSGSRTSNTQIGKKIRVLNRTKDGL